MSSTIEYNNDLKIIEITHTGIVTAGDLTDITLDCVDMISELGVYDVLIDSTRMQLSASLVDIFDLPEKQYSRNKYMHQIRVALVLPRVEKEKEAAQFYENACVNRGWMVKSFSQHNEALSWLDKKTSETIN